VVFAEWPVTRVGGKARRPILQQEWADQCNAELKINCFLLYMKDKASDNRMKGGGVLLYARERLCSHPMQYLTTDKFHGLVGCKTESESDTVIVYVCYRNTSNMQ